jgi:hypothetical protein
MLEKSPQRRMELRLYLKDRITTGGNFGPEERNGMRH